MYVYVYSLGVRGYAQVTPDGKLPLAEALQNAAESHPAP